MKINKVTITGVDDKVKIESLRSIQEKYPFVEWGVLINKGLEGQRKFPTSKWLGQLLSTAYNFNLSCHMCGIYARDFMNGKSDFVNTEPFKSKFERFQINFNFKTTLEYNLDEVEKQLKKSPDNYFIFTFNKANELVITHDILKAKRHTSNLHILYDSSGGRGTMMKDIRTPLPIYTGYSGGITPENVVDICTSISNFPNSSPTWIDMESGVRNEKNELDLLKVESVLQKAFPFIVE